LNHDIAHLVRRINRFQKEIYKSVSSNVNELTGHDRTRLVSYLEAIKAFKQWSVSQPLLDLPETSPMEVALGESFDAGALENDDLAVILNLLGIVVKEVVSSQSARRSSGMVSHDSVRFDTYIQKIEAFLKDFLDKISPLDLPESSPSAPHTGSGRTGI